VEHASHSSYNRSINRRIEIQAGPGKKQDPISKITNIKRAGGMGQAEPRKYKALS
jgi:hypothetical protein